MRMIAYPSSLLAVGGARTGIAPLNLLDVQDVNGNIYRWSDRRIIAPAPVFTLTLSSSAPRVATAPVPIPSGQLLAWAFPGAVAAVSGSPGGTASGNVSGNVSDGAIAIAYQGPFTTASTLTFSGFTMPTLPAGAVIQSAYLVTVTANSGNATFIGAVSGGGQGYSAITDTPTFIEAFTPVFSVWNTNGPLFGSPGYISAMLGYDNAELQVIDIAIAIYYTFPGLSFSGFGGGGSGGGPYAPSQYEPWILTVPQLTFHRSSVTDVGNFILQNLSGDTVSRDFEKIMRASALEGAFFVYRSWQPDAQASWIEVHGTLTVEDVGVDTVTLKGSPAINPAQDDTPDKQYGETCQWRWSSPQCGATGTTECQYSYQTCQALERILVVLNDFEKNYGETTANVPTQVINRRRRF